MLHDGLDVVMALGGLLVAVAIGAALGGWG